MRNLLFSLMLHFAQLFKNGQYPLPMETLARRLQDAADPAAVGDRLHREREEARLIH